MLQLLRIIVLLVFVSSNCFASLNAVQEEDGDPIVFPWKILLPNGSVTDNSDGTASITFGAGSIDGSGTTNELAYWSDADTLGSLAVATYPSLTELAYVKGVTSAIQTQLNAKESSTSNDFDPDRLAGDTTDNNLVDEAVIDSAIARDSELHSAVTFAGTGTYISLSGQQITVDPITESDISDLGTYLTSEVDGSITNELQNIFQTVSTTSGTSPVADSTTDTLTLTAGTGITITGDSATDVVTIATTIVDTDTNTNASTICSGTTTYLDGEGNCDDISSVYASALGSDDNYVTDAEKVVIGNTSGTNTGDQTTITGNAGTATALAANGANCSAGQYPLGVDASGAVESCTAGGGLLNIVEDTTPQLGGDLDSENKEIEDIKNVILKGTAVGTSGDGVIAIYNGTIPSTSPANGVQFYSEDVAAEATGGTISYSGGNTIHTFTSSGTFTAPSGGLTVDILLVGGGGGGGGYTGNFADGGGAGGYVYKTSVSASAGANSIVVGGGGAGGGTGGAKGTSGSDSTGLTYTATGGGGGGYYAQTGLNGGSGGGGSTAGSGNTPSTSPSQGNNGGTQSSSTAGGGGGGASAVGANGSGSSGGNGGNGTANSISGSSVTYAGGGGGGVYHTITSFGSGGTGGGGSGGKGATAATNGTANTGGGGGGGAGGTGAVTGGGSGGSGIVIISYATPAGSAEAKVRDEAGNITTLSPHNFRNMPKERLDLIEAQSDGLAWTYHSKNNCTYKEVMIDGKPKTVEDTCREITVDMFTLARLVEKISGEKLIYSNANIDASVGEVTIQDLKEMKAERKNKPK